MGFGDAFSFSKKCGCSDTVVRRVAPGSKAGNDGKNAKPGVSDDRPRLDLRPSEKKIGLFLANGLM